MFVIWSLYFSSDQVERITRKTHIHICNSCEELMYSTHKSSRYTLTGSTRYWLCKCCCQWKQPVTNRGQGHCVKSWGHVSFELFMDKMPKTAKHFELWAPEKKHFVIRVPASTKLFQDLSAKVVTSWAVMASHFLGRHLKIRAAHKVHRSWRLVLVFYLHGQTWVVGWQLWGLWECKRSVSTVESQGVH